MKEDQYNEIKAMIEDMYAAPGEGRWDDVKNNLTDDFIIKEAASLPYACELHGRGALQELYTLVFQYWEDPVVDMHDITVSGDNAIGLLTLNVTSRATGRRHALDIAEVFHLRGDRICGITPYYYDTAYVTKAAPVPRRLVFIKLLHLK